MQINKVQKGLFIVLLGLVALMVIFSVLAIKNTGLEGFNSCVQEKCDTRGEEFCSKFREINNCCLGAGGQLQISGNERNCVFN